MSTIWSKKSSSSGGTALNQYEVAIGNASNVTTPTNTNLEGNILASTATATITVTIAAPAVMTFTSHGLGRGDSFYLTTSGALPTGLVVNTRYYVSTVIDANTFNISSDFGNASASTNITTTGSQSGTHTIHYGGLNYGPFIEGNLSTAASTPGYIGQTISASINTGTQTLSSSSFVDITGASLTVSPGCWFLIFSVSGNWRSNGASAIGWVKVQATDNGGTLIAGTCRQIGGGGLNTTNARTLGQATASFTTYVSTNTIYKLQAALVQDTGASFGDITNNTDSSSTFYAIRIG